MADYNWFEPDLAELERKKLERERYLENFRQGFSQIEGILHACKRGCGTVVWDIEQHRLNVCRDENWNLLTDVT